MQPILHRPGPVCIYPYVNPLYCLKLYGNPLYCLQLYGNPLYCLQLYGNPLYCLKLYINDCSTCINTSVPVECLPKACGMDLTEI